MLEVIGAGFGRTGTHSLGLALEKLGLGPCYTILEVHRNPGHADLWTDAMNGKPVDWTLLFEAYRSCVEWPAVAFLPELVGHFPQAKAVLTRRDPAGWFESAKTTIFEALELSAQDPDPSKREGAALKRRLILERTFAGRHREKEHAIRVYEQHIENVLRLVPPDRLLQFDVRQGWEPLCGFLDQPVPDEPFPRLNERAEFIASAPDWVKKTQAGTGA